MEFCFVALEMTHKSGRKPEIFNSDQRFQFTTSAFVAKLQGKSRSAAQAESDDMTTSMFRGCGAGSNT